MEKKRKKEGLGSLYIYLVISFIVILIVIIVATSLYFNYKKRGLLSDTLSASLINGVKTGMMYGLVVGMCMMSVVARHIIVPIKKIKDATKKVATGDFNVKVDFSRSDEIGDLADNFNLMVDELNSIEYLRKDFVSNISHELKTPIASIQGFAKLLEDDNLSKEEKKEYIDIILEETRRLSNLSSNMIKLSNVENQEIVNLQEFRLDEQIRKAIIMLEKQMSDKNIKVSLNAKEVIITADQDLTMEIWINLLNNAIKYTEENGNIEVNVYDEEKFVRVEIKDTGIGIPNDKQERIFEKFYQAQNSHYSEGSGLGLAIVKRIVELLNGNISFESKEGEGTTFNVRLKK